MNLDYFSQHLLPIIVGLGIYWGIRVALLSLALWIMLKIQDLNYTGLGILGSAALVSVFDMIPFAGHPLAVVILLFCVLKMTHSDFIDVRFTVAVVYAATFLFQMLIISMAPGDLHVNARSLHRDQTPNVEATSDDDSTDNATNAVPSARKAPVAVAPAKKPQSPLLVTATNAPGPVVAGSGVDIVQRFKLKSVAPTAKGGMAMFDTGSKTYSLDVGESELVKISGGSLEVKLQRVTDNSADFLVDGALATIKMK